MKADTTLAPRPIRTAPIVALCFAISVLEGYDIQAIGVAAPKLAPALHLAPAMMGWVFTAGMVGLVIGAVLGGWLTDRMKRRPLLAASAAAFGVFSLATALAPDLPTLVAARFLTGLGLGGAMPSLINIAVEVSAPERRTRTVTAMFCGMPAGGASSGLFALYAFAHLDWRALFWAGGLAPLALLPFFRVLPETGSARPAGGEVRRRHPARALFGEGRALVTLLLWTTFGLTLLVLYLLLNWLPSLVAAKGFTAGAGAQAAMAFNLASVVGALGLGIAVDKIGLRTPVAVAFLGLIGGLLGLAAAQGLVMILACAGLCGFCILGAQYCLYGAAPMYYPTNTRGFSTGAAVAVGRLGSIIGPLVAGQLVALGVGASGLALAMAPVILVSGLAATAMATLGRTHDR